MSVQAQLLRAVHARPGVARSAVARQLGMSSGFATETTARLVISELLAERPAPPTGNRGGPTTSLYPHQLGPLVAVAAVAHETWRVAAVQLGGTMTATGERAHGRGEHEVLTAVAAELSSLHRRFGTRIQAVAIAVPGTVAGSRLVHAPNLGWHEVDLSVLWPHYGQGESEYSFIVGNDATFAAIAEARRGAAIGAGSMLHLYIDAGVGGALIEGGRAMPGANGMAGESWAIDEKPTGSKDPYALRRAALGAIRVILENGLRLRLRALAANHRAVIAGLDPAIHAGAPQAEASKMDHRVRPGDDAGETIELLTFFADRLKVQLREQGARHDLVDAVFALQEAGSAEGATGTQNVQDDLLLIVRRVEALAKFLDTDDGKNLLAGYKRATSIIRIEEKRDNRQYTGAPDPTLYTLPEEKALAQAIDIAKAEAERAVAAEDFELAMRAMAKLRPHVDAFFDKVTVNVDDPALRENRLKLLNEIRTATRAVADFSKIEG